MRAQGSILRETMRGCMPIVVGFVLAMIFCLLVTLCGCKPQQKIVEVERLVHDTTMVVDTAYIKDIVTLHDSIYVTETVRETVRDTVNTEVAWRYWTYDPSGNVTSLLDYTSSARQGKTTQRDAQSESTSVGGQTSVHEEEGSHSESKGHTEASRENEQVKTGLTRWQKLVMTVGYISLVVLALAVAFGGMRLYGRRKRL